MARDMTWIKAIEKVLSESEEAMHYKEIAEKIVADGLRKKVGATPSATVAANLARSLSEGDKSPFQKVGKGEYILKTTKDKSNKPKEDNEVDATGIITSFGMFWRRSFVDWNSKPKLLGMQQLGAEAVDFHDQIGIYLLYDGREIIYVGRSSDRPIGRRLYEHTNDRLATRWDRFSWFGILPVSDKGTLGKIPDSYNSRQMILAFESILIEALEPRQNRKRGDDLSAVEYFQKEDPEIERKKQKALLEAALSKV